MQGLGDALHVHFAHHARMLKIHPIDHTHWAGGDEVARHHPHCGSRHGGVGQALAEGGLDFVAQLAGGLLGAVQRHAVGDAQAIDIKRRVPFGQELFIDLRPKAMHQHHPDAHALDQGQVLHQVGQFASRNGFARNAHDKGFAPVHVDIGRHRSKPGHKGEVKNGRHGVWERLLSG